MPFIDSHCHFDFAEFDTDREQVWQRCHDRDIRSILIPGVEPNQWHKAKRVSESLDTGYYAVGLHPWWLSSLLEGKNVSEFPIVLSRLEAQMAPHTAFPKCVAIGECGLDASNGPSLDLQEQVVTAHLHWCKKFDLPVILHCHKSHAAMLRLLKAHRVPRGGVIHAFSGSTEIALEYTKLGFCLGAGGVITYPRANKTRKSFAAIPAHAYLLETDAPDMPIEGKQGKRNSPESIIKIAEVLAELRGETRDEVEHNSSENFARLFLQNRV